MKKVFFDVDGEIIWKDLFLIKRPKRQELKMNKDILYSSLIRCLHRDAEKYNALSKDLQNIENVKKSYESEIRKIDKEFHYMSKQFIEVWRDLEKNYGNDFVRDFERKRME